MKVKVAGRAMVVTSGLLMKDIELIKKIRPELMTLKEDGDLVFLVNSSERGGISNFGISFSDCDEEGYACLTVMHNQTENVKEYIAENYVKTFHNLIEVEKNCINELQDIKNSVELIKGSIE